MTLRSGSQLLASAHREGHNWTISTTGGSLFRLLQIDVSEVAVVDNALNVVATMHNASTSRFQSPLLLRDAQDRVIASVSADGNDGLNAMTPVGNPLLFAGRGRGTEAALDILLTDSGCERPLAILFGLLVALESGELVWLDRQRHGSGAGMKSDPHSGEHEQAS